MKTKKVFFAALTFLTLSLSPSLVFAADKVSAQSNLIFWDWIIKIIESIKPNDPNDCVDNDKQVPFDAGLSVLIGAGVAYSAKRSYNKKKSRTEN